MPVDFALLSGDVFVHKHSSYICPPCKAYPSCTCFPLCRDTMQLGLFQVLVILLVRRVHILGLCWWPGSYEQGFLKHNGLDTEC